jgi:hypothetical protein
MRWRGHIVILNKSGRRSVFDVYISRAYDQRRDNDARMFNVETK